MPKTLAVACSLFVLVITSCSRPRDTTAPPAPEQPAEKTAASPKEAPPQDAARPAPPSSIAPTTADQKKFSFWQKYFVNGKRGTTCKEALLSGALTQKLGPNLFEVDVSSPYVRCRGGCPHFVLRTTRGEFKRTGRVRACIKRDYEVMDVSRSDGFSDRVAVWTEDDYTDGNPYTAEERHALDYSGKLSGR